MGPGSCGSSRCFKLTAVFCVVLLMFVYYLSSTSYDNEQEQRRREYHSYVTTLYNYSDDHYDIYNYSVGLVWPRNDNINNDDNDRIQSQIDVMNVYARQKRKRKLKVILRVGNYNFENWFAGQEQFLRDRCPIVDCWLTNDQSQARDADALLISEFQQSSRELYLPKPRRQIWIAQHWESPLHNRIDPQSVRGLINWTASYRRDSTIAFRYDKRVPSAPATTTAATSSGGSVNYAAGKTKLVAWFVSNCIARNQRLRYARELSKFIQVDIYGQCGNLSCPRYENEKCLAMLERDYKFYLSFENSNCDDYITEKFWYTALEHKLVPVVMGARRRDYEAVAPPHSFIHVDDFAGARQLADYLHVLAGNDALYNEYHRWRSTTWTGLDQRYWCRLCALLYWSDDVDYVSWYDDYHKWWNGACR